MSATPRPTIHSIPMAELCGIAFEAFQQGAMTTHDALIRERLRRQFAADRAAAPPVERRQPGWPFSQSIA